MKLDREPVEMLSGDVRTLAAELWSYWSLSRSLLGSLIRILYSNLDEM